MKFKKTIFILLISLIAASAEMAQTADNAQFNYVRPDSPGTGGNSNNIISFGFGMGGYYPYTGTSYVENPNLTLLYENTIMKNVLTGTISLGGMFSYKSIYSSYTSYNNGYNYEQRWNYYILGARASYHVFPFANKNLELYAGAMLGYYITTFRFTSNDPNYADPSDPGYFLTDDNSPNFFALSIYAGVRSWITSHSSIWLEVGYGYTSMAFGASYKI